MHGLYGWHWLHGLHKDKRDVLWRKVITSTKPSVIASVGVRKPRLKTPRRVEAAGLPRHHIRCRYHSGNHRKATEPEVRDDAGYQPNKNAWVSPLSTPAPTSKLGLWYNMNQKKVYNMPEAFRDLPLIAIAVRLTAALTGPVHQLRTGGLQAGE